MTQIPEEHRAKGSNSSKSTASNLEHSALWARWEESLGRLLSGRYWWLWATAVATVVSLFFAFPTYESLSDPGRIDNWQKYLDQAEAPFDPSWAEDFTRGSHHAKLPLRPFVGVVGWVFGLGIPGFLALYAIASLIVIAASALLLERLTGDRVASALIAVAVACTYAGGSGFVQVRGFRDIVPIALLMLALLVKNPTLIGILVFCAASSDERAILAALIVVLFHSTVRNKTLLRAAVAPSLGVLAYVMLRLYMVEVLGFGQDIGGIGLPVLKEQYGYIALAPASALEMILPFVLVGIGRSLSRPSKLFSWAYASTVGVLVLVGLSVVDMTRSMGYLLPAVFLGVAVSPMGVTRRRARIAAIACALIPNYWLLGSDLEWFASLPVQIARWLGFG